MPVFFLSRWLLLNEYPSSIVFPCIIRIIYAETDNIDFIINFRCFFYLIFHSYAYIIYFLKDSLNYFQPMKLLDCFEYINKNIPTNTHTSTHKYIYIWVILNCVDYLLI